MGRIGERDTWFDSLRYVGLYENPFENSEEYPNIATYEPTGAVLLKEDMTYEAEFYSGYSTYIVGVYLPVNNESFGTAKVAIYNPVFGNKILDMTCICHPGQSL